MLAALLCSAALAAGSPSSDDSPSYATLNAQAGRSADAQVKLALWCESRGMTAERAKHLALAIAADPSHAVARGLLGFVNDSGKWRRPEDVADRAASDPAHSAAMAEYETQRDRAPATADGQWRLSRWCDAHGLKTQAEAHARATIRIDPDRKAARQRLGYKNVNGQWLSEAEIAAARKEADLQTQADRKWRPKLTRLRDDLRDKGRKAVAQAELSNVTDPRAVPSIVRVFATSDPNDQARLVQLLGQIEAPLASRLLAQVALYGDSSSVRRVASETLIRRDPREFAVLVIAQIRDVLKYEVQPVGGPGQSGVLMVEGEEYRVRRRYTPPTLPEATLRLIQEDEATFLTRVIAESGRVAFVPELLKERVFLSYLNREMKIAHDVAETRTAAIEAERQLEGDVDALKRENAMIRARNDMATTVLSATTGADLGPDRRAWAKWWSESQGLAYVSPPPPAIKPTFDQDATLNFQPAAAPQYRLPTIDCFAAGTPVRTHEGPRPIEALKVGDLVLSQDVTSGRLAFEPITAVFHKPPTPTVEVSLEGDSLETTAIHRFWKPGSGWVMARDLKPGDVIRTVGGTTKVRSVEPRPSQRVFNLEVDHARSFFIGSIGVLGHDHSLVDPTPEPFDGEK